MNSATYANIDKIKNGRKMDKTGLEQAFTPNTISKAKHRTNNQGPNDKDRGVYGLLVDGIRRVEEISNQ